MRIIVCMKQVPDPEGPRESFVVNNEEMRVVPQGIPPVLSLFDENALEAALRIKDKNPQDVKVSILSIGKRVSNAVMFKALAAGADELIKVEDSQFMTSRLDSFATATILAKAIENAGDFDLILVGRQAADWNAGQVGIILSGILNIPCVTLAQGVDVNGSTLTVERVLSNGIETVRTHLPAIVMVSNEIGELRYPAMKERREAKKKPVTEWNISDIGLSRIPPARIKLKRLFTPEMAAGNCLYLTDTTLEDAGRKLALLLKADGMI